MENEVGQHGEGQDVERGASIQIFRQDYQEQRKSTSQSKKKIKHIHTPKEKKREGNDSNESSQIKPFINMYDPFG